MNETSANAPGFYRTNVGDFRVIALHDGTNSRERGTGFIRNAEENDVEQAFRQIGVPPGQLVLTFSTLAIEMPDRLVLIDTGNGENAPKTAGHTASNLQAAGHKAADVDTVIISHFHGDHISGLIKADGGLMYANARVLVPQPEWDFWMNDESMNDAPERLQGTFKLCRRVFGEVGDRVELFNWGDEVLPGILAKKANGHTPGHTAFEIRSGNELLLFAGDVTNNPFVFARNPDWSAVFDIDPQLAVETRKNLLGEAADNNTRLFFYHAPFPSLGRVVRSASGFEFLPEVWK